MGRRARPHTRFRRLLHQLQALHHSEAVLLVDDDQAQIFEFDAILNQRVRSDDQLRIALRDVAANSRLRSCSSEPVSSTMRYPAFSRIWRAEK